MLSQTGLGRALFPPTFVLERGCVHFYVTDRVPIQATMSTLSKLTRISVAHSVAMITCRVDYKTSVHMLILWVIA